MPLIAHNDLPSYSRLAGEGQILLGNEAGRHQDIRELHIGLLNMMPDAALEATERQFLRLVGASNRMVRFYVHLFTVDGLDRGAAARRHISRFYERFDDIAEAGLDALIITGANISGPDLTREAFYRPLTQVSDWASENVTSVLCSCLASHAIWRHRFGIERRPLANKLWGVFQHRNVHQRHALISGINTRFDAPHSRHNDVSREQIQAAGMTVLTESKEAGVLLATSSDGLRFVFLQGHPEYDTTSLAKEYKREVQRFTTGARSDYPPLPANYFDASCVALLEAHRRRVEAGVVEPGFPEDKLAPRLDNTWIDTGKAIFNNWLGLVDQNTGCDRRAPLKQGADKENPLQLVTS